MRNELDHAIKLQNLRDNPDWEYKYPDYAILARQLREEKERQFKRAQTAVEIELESRVGKLYVNPKQVSDYKGNSIDDYTCGQVLNIGLVQVNESDKKDVEEYNNVKLVDKFYTVKDAFFTEVSKEERK